MKILYSAGYTYISSDKLELATQTGNLNVFLWLIDTFKWPISPAIVSVASKCGSLSILKWIHFNRADVTFTRDAMYGACTHGHFEVVKWLHFSRQEITEIVINEAFEYALILGHDDIVDFFLRHRREKCYSFHFQTLVKRKIDHDLLHRLFASNPSICLSSVLLDKFAIHGRIDMLDFFHTYYKNVSLSNDCIQKIIHEKMFPVLDWLRRNNRPELNILCV